VKTIRVQRLAREDIRSTARWYEYEREGIGERYLAAVAASFTILEAMSEVFVVVEEPNVRRCIVANPFQKHVIYYRATELEVSVLAVLHSARDVDTWKKRI
jgi:plasmid stabilization system protein ParE